MSIHPHLVHLQERYPDLSACVEDIGKAFDVMRHSLANNGKLLLCGNGGSAADADHWAGELLKGFRSKRPLTSGEKANLPPLLAEQLQRPLCAIPLTSFAALTTAFSNDVAPELCFAQLTWALGNAGDVFVGISTSGNAKNVGLAAQAARARGLHTIGLAGQSGGALKQYCDVMICVPATETYLVQEFHLPIYHCLSLMLEDEFFK